MSKHERKLHGKDKALSGRDVAIKKEDQSEVDTELKGQAHSRKVKVEQLDEKPGVKEVKIEGAKAARTTKSTKDDASCEEKVDSPEESKEAMEDNDTNPQKRRRKYKDFRSDVEAVFKREKRAREKAERKDVTTFGENASDEATTEATETKRYRCDSCPYATQDKAKVKIHVAGVHLNSRPFACPHCEDKFQREYHLRRHARVQHKRNVDASKALDSTQLASVGAGFTDSKASEEPAKIQKVGGLYLCDRCPFTAAKRFRVTNHAKAVHDRLKPHKCPRCTYAAARRDHVRRHAKTSHGMDIPKIR